MEQLILIIAFGLIALIAMSQCAHHSSRCHEKLDAALLKRTTIDSAQTWGHTASGGGAPEEPSQEVNADREQRSNLPQKAKIK